MLEMSCFQQSKLNSFNFDFLFIRSIYFCYLDKLLHPTYTFNDIFKSIKKNIIQQTFSIRNVSSTINYL